MSELWIFIIGMLVFGVAIASTLIGLLSPNDSANRGASPSVEGQSTMSSEA